MLSNKEKPKKILIGLMSKDDPGACNSEQGKYAGQGKEPHCLNPSPLDYKPEYDGPIGKYYPDQTLGEESQAAEKVEEK